VLAANKMAQELLNKLNACEINFDPRHDHNYGIIQVKKIAFVPIEVVQEIKELLKSLQTV